jgi:hypothetical protein
MRCSRRLATYVSISTTSRRHFWHSKRCVSTSSSLFSSSRLRQYVSIPSSVRCVDFTGTSRWCAADYHDGKLDEAPLFLMINVPRGRIGAKLRVLKLSISGVLAGMEWRLNTQRRPARGFDERPRLQPQSGSDATKLASCNGLRPMVAKPKVQPETSQPEDSTGEMVTSRVPVLLVFTALPKRNTPQLSLTPS